MEHIDFKSKNQLYEFFSNNQYKIGDSESVQPEMVFGKKIKSINNNINELYQVVFEEEELFQIWLLITSNEVRKKSWRTIIAKKVAESIGDFVLFMTKDYSKFYIQIIVDDMIEEITFQPENPSVKADRFLDNLSNKQPLIDPMGLTASQLQAKHELTATKLADAILSKEGKKVELLFKRAGLANKKNTTIITSRPNAPLKEAEIIVNFSDKDTRNIQWINSNFGHTIGTYYQATGNNLKWLIILGLEGVSYLNSRGELLSFIESPEEKEALILLLTSIIANIDIRAAFNGETFEQQFGSYSPFFAKATFLMKNYLDANKKDIGVVREEWERFFGKVYQAGDVDEELFVKHAYLSLLIKNVLFSKYLADEVVSSSQSFVELTKYFEERGVELFFHDFYAWANNISELREDLFQALKGATYESDDIFRVIYQDMVSPSTRSALGEFYTKPELALLMVDDVYEFGQRVLDPACGSGTFLVEIIKKIKESGKSSKEILKAISRLYGFDVNPIAVLVSKANILLHLEEFYRKMLPVNIFLTDSLFPVKKEIQDDLNWGKSEKFIMGEEIEDINQGKKIITGSIGELRINSRFFQQPTKKVPYNYMKEFGRFLRFIEEQMIHGLTLSEILKAFADRFTLLWLDEPIKGSIYGKTFRDNIHYIIEELFSLNENKKNHIWLYLLYNELGTRIINNNVDLVIGNPPWITVAGILSEDYKIQIKNLAKSFNILYGKEAKNTEICTLFYHIAKKLYTRENGRIFFVTPASLLTGNQHSKFRFLEGFSQPIVWKFTEDVFNIHNICFQTIVIDRKMPDEERLTYKVRVFDYHVSDKTVSEKELKSYTPAYIKKETKMIKGKEKVTGTLVGRMNPVDEEIAFQIKESYYRNLFNAGLRFFPRRYLFCFIENIEGDNVNIIPDLTQQYRNNDYAEAPFNKSTVNRDFIHDLITTDGCIPYHALKYNKVFFLAKKNEPINFEFDLVYLKRLPKNVKKHYDILNKAFKENLKSAASVNNLWENITYGPCTVNKQEDETYLVLSAKSSQKSLVITSKDVLVDNNFYFFETNDLEEAYYICGYLNSNIIFENVTKLSSSGARGSVRNIHKRPFDFPFPKFEGTSSQMELVKISLECEEFVKKFVNEWGEKQFRKNMGKYYCQYCLKEYSEKSIERHTGDCNRKDKSKSLSTSPMKIASRDDIVLKLRTLHNQLNKSNEYNSLLSKLDDIVIQIMKGE